jgi:hypothetical protein
VLRHEIPFAPMICPRPITAVLLLGAALAPEPACAGKLFAHTPMALRKGPSENFAVVTQVDVGTRIDVLWCRNDGDWCLVDDGLMQGWAPILGLLARPASASGGTGNALSNGGGASDSSGDLGLGAPLAPSSDARSGTSGNAPAASAGAGSASAGASVSVGSGGAGAAVSDGGASVSVKLP